MGDFPVNPNVEVIPDQAKFLSGSGSHVVPGSAPVSGSLVLGSVVTQLKELASVVNNLVDFEGLQGRSVSSPVPDLSPGFVNNLEASSVVPDEFLPDRFSSTMREGELISSSVRQYNDLTSSVVLFIPGNEFSSGDWCVLSDS